MKVYIVELCSQWWVDWSLRREQRITEGDKYRWDSSINTWNKYFPVELPSASDIWHMEASDSYPNQPSVMPIRPEFSVRKPHSLFYYSYTGNINVSFCAFSMEFNAKLPFACWKNSPNPQQQHTKSECLHLSFYCKETTKLWTRENSQSQVNASETRKSNQKTLCKSKAMRNQLYNQSCPQNRTHSTSNVLQSRVCTLHTILPPRTI